MYLRDELYELIRNDETLFDFIQEYTMDGLWYWDLKNPENEWMNARFWKVLGYNPDEMPHKSSAWQSIINQDDLKEATENLKKHCQDPNHPYDQVVRYRHKDGSAVWVRCRGRAIPDAEGVPVRMLGAHQDVTELKKKEQELSNATKIVAKCEEEYRAFYPNAPLSYQSLDENGHIIDINPMWLKTLGYEREEVVGKNFSDFLHPDYHEHFRINFPEFKKRGFVSDVQFMLRKKNNTFIYVSYEGCVGYTAEGKFRQTYCVFKDITEQKLLEEAFIKAKKQAMESEAKLNSLFDSMSEMVVLHELVFNEHGEPVNYRITECNKAFVEITGISQDAAIGRLATEVYGIEQPPFLDVYAKVALSGIRAHHETFYPPMDKHFSISVVSPEKNRFATVTTDITEHRQAEEALKRSKELHAETESIGKVGGWSFNIDTLAQEWTEEVYRIHELEILPNPGVETGINYYTEESKPIIRRAVQRAIEYGEDYDLELEIITAKGNVRAVHTIGKSDLKNRRIHGFFQDITEHKQAEQALLAKMDELERFHKLTVGRELTMIELKKEVNELLNLLGKESKYKIVE